MLKKIVPLSKKVAIFDSLTMQYFLLVSCKHASVYANLHLAGLFSMIFFTRPNISWHQESFCFDVTLYLFSVQLLKQAQYQFVKQAID